MKQDILNKIMKSMGVDFSYKEVNYSGTYNIVMYGKHFYSENIPVMVSVDMDTLQYHDYRKGKRGMYWSRMPHAYPIQAMPFDEGIKHLFLQWNGKEEVTRHYAHSKYAGVTIQVRELEGSLQEQWKSLMNDQQYLTDWCDKKPEEISFQSPEDELLEGMYHFNMKQ